MERIATPERGFRGNGTLSKKRHSIVELGTLLPDTMPVKIGFHSVDMVSDIDDDPVVLANLNTRSRQHSVYRQYSSLETISLDALALGNVC